MTDSNNILYLILLVGYLVAVGWYVRSTMAFRRAGGEKKPSSRGGGRRHKKAGKHCPECKEMIDARRTVCQHCGHKFDLVPADPHPDEVWAGIVPPASKQIQAPDDDVISTPDGPPVEDYDEE